MELAPYLYIENGYTLKDLLEYIKLLNYSFFEFHNLKEISNIFEYAENINDGSSKNIILK